MPAVQRVGDRNEAGGVIQNGDSSVLINGRAVAVVGSKVTAHPCCGSKGCPPTHCSATTTAKTTNVFVNGKPIIVTGDTDTCGHKRQGGSTSIQIG
jgi:uncharacterized Zn-binding protein involved in type VI secretion